MELDKQIKKEVLQVYDTWLQSYMNGDVATYDSYFDDDFHFIGSTGNEEFLSRQATTKFFESTADQMAGKTAVRNETKRVEQFGELVFITHLFDGWFHDGNDWTFYSRFRFTNVLQKTAAGWRFIYQHYSTPDTKAQEGETIGYEQVSAENQQLREAVKRRTIELEQKNRELEIEAALERVRSKTMAMHSSADVDITVITLFDELLKLGVNKSIRSGIAIMNQSKIAEVWTGSTDPSTGNIFLDKGILDTGLHPLLIGIQEAWEAKKPTHTYLLEGDDLIRYFKVVNDAPDYSLKVDLEKLPEKIIHYDFFFPDGYLFAFSPVSFSEETARLFSRFAAVFAQTYRRFLDLQKAEAQARDAQIEAAVERVRAEAMAMHSTEDFGKVSRQLLQQVRDLALNGFTGATIYLIDENEIFNCYDFSSFGNMVNATNQFLRYDAKKFPVLGKYPLDQWKKGEHYFELDFDIEKLRAAVKEFEEINVDVANSLKSALEEGHLTHQWDACGRISQGFLAFDMTKPPDEDAKTITIKMTHAFEQAYIRFLDLQKAEAQAREARIEAALEKVRSRTIAMRKADELHEVVTVVVEKLVDLGVVLDANGVILCTYFPDSRDVLHWIASPDFSFTGSYLLPYFDHPIFSTAWESKISGADYFSKSFTVEEKNSFFEYAFEHSDYKHFPDDFKQWVFQNDKHSLSFAWSKNSAILIPSHTGVIPTAEEAEILKRFAKVFEQAYVRFMDLQKAEKQAKEALKQAALDRVRGEIASMRSTEDLNRITPVIWRELTSLDVPFIRCGVFIVDEASEVVEVYLSTPEGKALGVLHLPFDVNTQTTNTVKYWREKKVYREYWDAPAFIEWTQSMIEMGQVKNFADYQGAAKIPDELHLHFVPFKQGMLYVGDVNPLQEEKVEMVKTLAEAFSIAYARYEDFVRLEDAKSKVEAALAELKATQAQLIQSEKMASLGELTAGIAHEIQNPLNFVNNFSEVTNELLEEMQEEMEKGDLEETRALADDIKKNLEKINHHGKRADAIVKGMLEHSRQSSGEKIPTDINQLADEYLRLAYHGLRAKDNSFNATLHTDFDPMLEPILVIPQDIGKVLLNLIANAFYAIHGKKKEHEGDYQPTLTLSTHKANDHIIIDVKDNGIGIPQHLLDKIFQPFFTTKPTGQGTGLGLSLSYDIVKAHEGKLEVETKEGIHTIFRITLPIKK